MEVVCVNVELIQSQKYLFQISCHIGSSTPPEHGVLWGVANWTQRDLPIKLGFRNLFSSQVVARLPSCLILTRKVPFGVVKFG